MNGQYLKLFIEEELTIQTIKYINTTIIVLIYVGDEIRIGF